MAIINMERIAQLKNERDIEIEVLDNHFNIWRDGISERISSIQSIANDIRCTYHYLNNNKLNTDLFKVENLSASFSCWSAYGGHQSFIRCKISSDWEARFFMDKGKIQLERHIAGMIDDVVFPFDVITLKRKQETRNLIEEAILRFEAYCKIVVERLNNL